MGEREGKKATTRRNQPKLFALRTVSGREIDVAVILEDRIKTLETPIYSIIYSPDLKGVVILETPAAFYVSNIAQGLRYTRGLIPGAISYDDIDKVIKPKAIVEMLKPGDIVEIASGPFKGMKAQVIRVHTSKNEVVLNVLEVEYPLQVSVPGDSVRVLKEKVS